MVVAWKGGDFSEGSGLSLGIVLSFRCYVLGPRGF